jgi:hypothetical protein
VKIVTFFFGSGWWVLWHLFILGSAVPMLFALRWLRKTKPGEGPQGGEAAFMVLVGIALSLIVATVVDGGMLGWTIAEINGAMWGTIAGLVFCTIWTLLLFAFAKKLVAPADDTPQSTTPTVILCAVWHAGIVAANLVALAKIRP